MLFVPTRTGPNWTTKDEVSVTDFNGVKGDSFQVFYSEQRADFLVPGTGLTNQQSWDKHGVAIAGAVLPANAVARAGVVGKVAPSGVA